MRDPIEVWCDTCGVMKGHPCRMLNPPGSVSANETLREAFAEGRDFHRRRREKAGGGTAEVETESGQ